MRMNEVQFDGSRPVDGYGPGFFRIGGEMMHGPLILAPSGVAPWTGFDATEPLRNLADEADFILIGTGAEIAPPPAAFRQALDAAGLATEFMASPAACRTYNVLLAEGRRVAAALIPVG